MNYFVRKILATLITFCKFFGNTKSYANFLKIICHVKILSNTKFYEILIILVIYANF